MDANVQELLHQLRSAARDKPPPLGRFADLRNGGLMPGARRDYARIAVYACLFGLALFLRG